MEVKRTDVVELYNKLRLKILKPTKYGKTAMRKYYKMADGLSTM